MPTLEWIGKKAVVNHDKEVPFHLLREEPKLSAGDAESGNLIVEGDNLVALKALLPYYAGKVKCIYIDPPYNTGNENWVYNDNVNSPEIREWLGKVVGKESEDLSRHDKWLCMMYPRLILLRQFLREDGAIFVSIDDNEAHRLKLLCDEIFGTNNFVSNVIWQKKYSPQNDAKWLSDNHDHIIIFAKNKEIWRPNLLPRSEKMNARYKNPDNDPRGLWKPSDLSVKTYSAIYDYPIITPSGRTTHPPKGYCWRVSKQKLQELIDDNRIWFGESGNNVPAIKRFLSEVKEGITSLTIWTYDEVGHNQDAKKEIKEFDHANVFDTPKPLKLLQKIVLLSSGLDGMILDAFAGSGTTGHAVMQLNKEDGGNRKFILVEMEQKIAREVTAERLKKVSQGYKKASNGEQVESLGSGFQYCTLGKPLFDEVGKINKEVTFRELAHHVFFIETGTALAKGARLDSPLLGECNGAGVYLLYNGILKDKSVNGGNVLTQKVLDSLPRHEGLKIIFGTACRLGAARLKRENIVFKQIPYAIKTT